ncbi:MAG: hypothetical protein ABH878_06230, partial [bacterium]
MLHISAEISGVKYTPFLCRTLETYGIRSLRRALDKSGAFLLNVTKSNKMALSWWVSPKRTRSYPYARVYDTLSFQGKKVTIIPVFKDEGRDGDRDFIQWDTISLMSLLGVYSIISYYHKAQKNRDFRNKITNQEFDIQHVKGEIRELLSFHSDALHWNLRQIEQIGTIGKRALEAYQRISKVTGVELHSRASAEKRVLEVLTKKETFLSSSRDLAQRAQYREGVTIQ